MNPVDLKDYWRRRCVKAEELLIHVGCDPDWTATIDAHFEKIRTGELSSQYAAEEKE
jgi:hypothetical protein